MPSRTATRVGDRLRDFGLPLYAADVYDMEYAETGDLGSLQEAITSFIDAGEFELATIRSFWLYREYEASGDLLRMDTIKRQQAYILFRQGRIDVALGMLGGVAERQRQRGEYDELSFTRAMIGYILLSKECDYALLSVSARHLQEALSQLHLGGNPQHELQAMLWWLEHPFMENVPSRRRDDALYALKLALFSARNLSAALTAFRIWRNAH